MKKAFKIIFCLLFFGICTVFSLGMMIPGASNASEHADSLPRLVDSGKVNHSFGNDLEAWFAENFAFRNAVVDAFSELKMNIFAEGNSQVIVGKDDFLFFDETLDCYMGNNMMTDGELSDCADTLLKMQKAAAEAGAEFVFICAPNKNTVYSEMMPDRYTKNSGESDMDRLFALLDSRGVNYVDVRDALASEKDSGLVYHKRDSHWNGMGAEIAFSEICNALGTTPADLSSKKKIVSNTFEGDLDALLFPGDVRYDSDFTYDFEGMFIYTSAYATPMDITITTRGGGEGKLLMFRDSFGNALLPYAAASFSEVRFERATPYKSDLIESFGADFAVIEIAERNLRDLAKYGE